MHLSNFVPLLHLISFAAAVPHDIQPSKHPLSKRTLPPLDAFPNDEESQKRRTALSEALSDTLLLAQQVSLSYPGDDGSGSYADIWGKYFPPADHEKVKGVWDKIMSDPNNPGQGEHILRTAVIVGFDIMKAQLNVELCTPGVEAYTNPFPIGFDNRLPNTATFTFFCDPAFTLPDRYGDLSCAKVGDTVSSKMEFLGASILHEWMHNDGVGKAGTGGDHIGDYKTPEDVSAGYGPYKTRQLLINKPDQCIKNADSFVYLALEILWTKACKSGNDRFLDPVPDTSTGQGPPSIPADITLTKTFSDSSAPTATIPPFSTRVSNNAPAAITCEYAADPDGARGLCPNLANDGWCDCGDAGTFELKSGDDICGYSTLPLTGSISLSTTGCTTTSSVTITVIPIPASTL
ncbi:MAG: hypothetical protein Q9190_006502 [Brigantiaea leucoxantha]